MTNKKEENIALLEKEIKSVSNRIILCEKRLKKKDISSKSNDLNKRILKAMIFARLDLIVMKHSLS